MKYTCTFSFPPQGHKALLNLKKFITCCYHWPTNETDLKITHYIFSSSKILQTASNAAPTEARGNHVKGQRQTVKRTYGKMSWKGWKVIMLYKQTDHYSLTVSGISTVQGAPPILQLSWIATFVAIDITPLAIRFLASITWVGTETTTKEIYPAKYFSSGK